MKPELKVTEQDMTNPFKNISLTPYRLISAGNGPKDVLFPDGFITSAADTKRDLEYPQLFAWNLEGKPLLEWVQYKLDHPECKCDLVVDSGAFSTWSKGREFDKDEYIDFLNSNKVIDVAFWCAEADKIPGKFGVDPTPEEIEAAPEESWENYIYMIKRVRIPKKIVPIFHMGEDYKHLLRMLRYQFEDGDFIPYIGLSPRNDVHVGEKIKWYEATWKVIYDECERLGRAIPLTHNFGCTTISIMEQYPSCSSDSTSWLRCACYGNIIIIVNGKMKLVCVSNRQTLADDHINNQPLAIKEAVNDVCKQIGHGLTLETLLNDDEKGRIRAVFNLYSLNLWKKDFEYIGTQQFKEELW